VAGYKINLQKLTSFYTPIANVLRKITTETCPLTVYSNQTNKMGKE
jgi:energy-converting hydrogenase Eha subunit F